MHADAMLCVDERHQTIAADAFDLHSPFPVAGRERLERNSLRRSTTSAATARSRQVFRSSLIVRLPSRISRKTATGTRGTDPADRQQTVLQIGRAHV